MIKIYFLGTGTPNPDPERSGPAVAMVVEGHAYLFDCGVNVVRQAEKARKRYDEGALRANGLDRLFLTHLHSDHTLGLADWILTPWVMEKTSPSQIFGPTGTKSMVSSLLKAYEGDIHTRIQGLEKANPETLMPKVEELADGWVYRDEHVEIKAFPVVHPPFQSFGYVLSTRDHRVVLSGDTAPSTALIRHAKGADVLIHEVISTKGVEKRDPKWKKYHENVHTKSVDLGSVAMEAQPKQLVLYHQLWMPYQAEDGRRVSEKESEKTVINDIRKKYSGRIDSATDLYRIIIGGEEHDHSTNRE